MNSPIVKHTSAHHDVWLYRPYHAWRSLVTSSKLTAVVCIAIAIFLLLAPPMSFGLRQKIGPHDREAAHIPAYLVIALLALVGTMVLSATVAINISDSPKDRYFITIFTTSLAQAHNYYINIAAEIGSIGLLVFLLFLMGNVLLLES